MKGIKSSAHTLLGEEQAMADLLPILTIMVEKSSELCCVHEKPGVALDLSGCRGRVLQNSSSEVNSKLGLEHKDRLVHGPYEDMQIASKPRSFKESK